MSGQLDVPADMHPGKELPVHIEQETGWAPEPGWTFREHVNISVVQGFERQIIQPIA
jgi:hypothetical protein